MESLQSVIGKVQLSNADSVRNNTSVRLEKENKRLFALKGIHQINKGELIQLDFEEGFTLYAQIMCSVKNYKILNPSNLKEVLFSHSRLY